MVHTAACLIHCRGDREALQRGERGTVEGGRGTVERIERHCRDALQRGDRGTVIVEGDRGTIEIQC